MPQKQLVSPTGLYALRKWDKEWRYWTCSPVHACGWGIGKPKQAFTKTEVGIHLHHITESGESLNGIEIVELLLPAHVTHVCLRCKNRSADYCVDCLNKELEGLRGTYRTEVQTG